DLPDYREQSAFGVLNGRFVLAGGRVGGAGSVGSSVVGLDLSAPTGACASLPNLPTPHVLVSGSSIGRAFYTVGGADASFNATQELCRHYAFACPTSTPTNTPTRTNTPTPTRTGTPTITPTCGPAAWSQLASHPLSGGSIAVAAINGLVYSF